MISYPLLLIFSFSSVMHVFLFNRKKINEDLFYQLHLTAYAISYVVHRFGLSEDGYCNLDVYFWHICFCRFQYVIKSITVFKLSVLLLSLSILLSGLKNYY